jgi:hypothetical protein
MLKFMLDKCTYAKIPMDLGSLTLQNEIGMPKFDVMLYPFMLGSCMPSSTHGLALVML